MNDGGAPIQAFHDPLDNLQPTPCVLRPDPNAWQLRPSIIVQPESYFKTLELGKLFPETQPLEVELGSGDGSFLVQYAALKSGHNFLGVERLLGRLRKIDRKARRLGLANVRALRIEAAYFLEYMLPPNSIAALHVYFPDPWPKRKHRKNRLINSRFTELAARVLTENGRVYLRTDDADYFAQMTSVFSDSPAFRPRSAPEELIKTLTDFEREFHTRGIPSLTAAYVRT